MKKLERLVTINKLSQKDKKWIHRDIFRLLYKEELWIAAYENLKNNKGALTPGSISETMDGMSLERLKRLQKKVCDESYRFKPVKLIYISKADGRKRPLGLPTANDKIVQEVIRIILETIYEPIFSKLNFGFRRNQGCHDALHHVEEKFRWVDYVIEGDIEQAYPTIDHHVLVNLIEKRIDDPRFIRLIWKLLGCGILDEERITQSKIGVPQGSIVSSVLANIYYHELDEFVEQINKTHTTPRNSRKYRKSPIYKSLEYQITKISEELRLVKPQTKERHEIAKRLKVIRKKRLECPALKEKIIRIEYVRYADDWMIGVAGDKELALDIQEKIGIFMKNSLKQKMHPVKTKLTNIRKGNVNFLGYEIFLPRNRPISSYKGKGVKTIRRGQPELRFDIPVKKITKRYADRGYLKIKTKGARPISRAAYAVLEDHVIVSHYRRLWFGVYNYYMGCTNRGRLQYIHYLLHMSCAMTLGHKHRMSCSKVFQKHRKNLTVKVPHTDKTITFPYKTKWGLNERRWLLGKKDIALTHHYTSLVTKSSLGLACAICDSEQGPIEMHHVKHVRKNGYRYKGFHEQMALLNRKQIPLCKNCHKKVHAGL